ncbi:MAG TPA: NADH-quinone oxidoreductase subunit C [Rhodanobacteraceae bacterium]
MSEQATETPLAGQLKARFGDTLQRVICAHGETTIEVAAADFIAVVKALRDEPEFRFACFTDVAGVDYLHYGQVEWDTRDVTGEGFSRGVEGQATGRFDWEDRPTREEVSDVEHRFASVLHLLSLEHNRRIGVRVFCDDDSAPVIPSVTPLWSGANWFEREAFDLFGIVYEGHPDLRRILTDYGFVGHPFRKDFPTEGYVEMRYDPERQRVIYQPVTIEPREVTPRVVREENYAEDE